MCSFTNVFKKAILKAAAANDKNVDRAVKLNTGVDEACYWLANKCPVIQLHFPGNTKGGSVTVPLTSCLTGLESAV